MSEAQQQASGAASDAARKAALAAAILAASKPPAPTTTPTGREIDYGTPVYIPPPVYTPPASVVQPDYLDSQQRIDQGQTTAPTQVTVVGQEYTPPPASTVDYVDAPERVINAQGGESTNPNVVLNEIISDVGTQKVIIQQAESNLDNYITQSQAVTETLTEQITVMEDVVENSEDYRWTPGQLKEYKAKLEEKKAALAEIEATAPVDIASTLTSIALAKQNLGVLQAMSGVIKGRVDRALANELKATSVSITALAPPDELDVFAGRGGDVKWRVVAANGEVKEFTDYMDAVAYASDNWMPVGEVNLSVNAPAPFVDAPGMEGYVASLNLPTTQSGINQQGWVDARIEDVSGAIRNYGIDLENRAKVLKVGGYDAWAGVYASGAVGVGVASALFDASTWMANPFPREQHSVLTDFKDNPMFATGVVGGNVAIALYGLGSTYKYLKAKGKWLTPAAGGTAQDTINPLGSKTAIVFGDDAARPAYLSGEGMNVPGNYEALPFEGVDNPIEWPIGSPEYNTAKLMRGDSRAFAMVEYDVVTQTDDIYRAAASPYMTLDAPIYYAYVGGRAVAVEAPVLAGLGSVSATTGLLGRNQAVIDAMSSKVGVPSITAVLNKTTLLPVQLPESVARAIVRTDAIQVPIASTESIQIPEVIPVETAVTDTITEQITEPIIDPVIEPVIEPVDETPPGIKDIPDPEPPEETPLPPVTGKGKESKRRGSEEKEGRIPTFTVRMRYGRKSMTRLVEAGSFREALVKVLRGSPSEVEVRRRG